MGLFDGLFGGSKKAKFQRVTPFDNLPGFLKESGRGIGTNAFDVFRQNISRGETDAARELFSRSRTRTLQDFDRATQQAGLNLNRLGLSSSGARDRTFAALALSLGDTLAEQDAQRAERLRANQLAGASRGLNAINSLSGSTALIPETRTKGLLDGFGTSLIGLGTLGALSASVPGLGGAAVQGLFGGQFAQR
jgi:hypothetical protein